MAEKVEFSMVDTAFGSSKLFDTIDPRGINRKNPFNFNAIRGIFLDDEVLVFSSTVNSQDDAVKSLDSLFILFFNKVVNLDTITDFKGNIFMN